MKIRSIYAFIALALLLSFAPTAYAVKQPKTATVQTTEKTQCTAATKSGTRCKRKCADGSAFCPQHTKMKAAGKPVALFGQ